MPPRKRSTPTSIADVIPRVYPSKEPAELHALRAFRWWDKAVPRRVAENARPVRLSRGVLTVHTATATWAHELSYLSGNLLASVQKFAPRSGVRELRIRVGPLPSVPRPPEPEKPRRIPIAKLPDEVARALAHVRDDALRDIIAEAASYSLGETKAR